MKKLLSQGRTVSINSQAGSCTRLGIINDRFSPRENANLGAVSLQVTGRCLISRFCDCEILREHNVIYSVGKSKTKDTSQKARFPFSFSLFYLFFFFRRFYRLIIFPMFFFFLNIKISKYKSEFFVLLVSICKSVEKLRIDNRIAASK